MFGDIAKQILLAALSVFNVHFKIALKVAISE